jgi:hypothetical protein
MPGGSGRVQRVFAAERGLARKLELFKKALA